MKQVKLRRSVDCCRSDEDGRIRGQRYRNWIIQANFPKKSIGHFFQLSLYLPCSFPTYECLGKLKPSSFRSECLTLALGKSGRMIIPNIWKECPFAVKAFRKNFRNLSQRIDKILPGAPDGSESFQEFLLALEAALPGHFDPLFVSLLGGRFGGAQPTAIDMTAIIPKIYKSARRPSPGISEKIQRFFAELSHAHRKREGAAAKKALANLTAEIRDPMDQVYVDTIMATYRQPGRSFNSAKRIARGAVSVLARFIGGDSYEDANGPEAVGWNEARGAVNPIAQIPVRRRRSSPRPFALTPPDAYFRLYGLLDRPPQGDAPVADYVRRIYADLLMFCGRRGCCLLALTLGDFTVVQDPISRERLVTVTIRFTKGKRQVPVSLQLWALLPDAELDVIVEFLRRTASEPRSKTLFSFLVQHREFWKDNPEDFAEFLRTKFLPPDVDSMHLPRACFVTFWLLRVLCAHNRELLALDCMREIRENVWFSGEMLDKLCKIVSGPEVDALEICRRNVGHSSTYECIADYCRGWYFVLKVRFEARHRRHNYPKKVSSELQKSV